MSGKLQLTVAVENDDIAEVERILTEAEFTEGDGAAAALVNAKDPNNFGMTAVHEASYSNQVEIVKVLLKSYSAAAAAGRVAATNLVDHNVVGDINIVRQQGDDNNGGGGAAAGNDDDEVGSVGGGGGENIDLDIQDNNGWTPLMCAVINNYIEIFKVILEHGASVDIQNSDGSSALTLAAEKNHGEAQEMVELLVSHGAQLDLQESGKQNATALILAAKNNHREIFDLLLKSGAAVDLQDKEGRTALYCLCDNSWTALMVAATDNRVEMVTKICEAGANVNLADSEGETPVHVATKWGHPDVVEVLIKFGAVAPEGALEEARERSKHQRSTAEQSAQQAQSLAMALSEANSHFDKLNAILDSVGDIPQEFAETAAIAHRQLAAEKEGKDDKGNVVATAGGATTD